jgi:hypothetical protein
MSFFGPRVEDVSKSCTNNEEDDRGFLTDPITSEPLGQKVYQHELGKGKCYNVSTLVKVLKLPNKRFPNEAIEITTQEQKEILDLYNEGKTLQDQYADLRADHERVLSELNELKAELRASEKKKKAFLEQDLEPAAAALSEGGGGQAERLPEEEERAVVEAVRALHLRLLDRLRESTFRRVHLSGPSFSAVLDAAREADMRDKNYRVIVRFV